MCKLTTIRTRISLLTGGLLLLILTGFSLFLYFSLSNQLYQALDEHLYDSVQEWLVLVEREDGPLHFDKNDLPPSTNRVQDDIVRLISPSGELLDERSGKESIDITFPLHSGLMTLPYQAAAEETDAPPSNSNLLRLLTVSVESNGTLIAYLQIGSNLEAIEQALADLRALLLIAAPALVLVAALAGYWLTGRALAPIEAIRTQATMIGAHDLSLRISQKLPNDEVGRLARTFNEMLARLDATFRRLRQFTAEASHELRTPLAIIRGEVDVTLEQLRTSTDYIAALRTIGSEAERMTRLVNGLLLLARSDDATLQLEWEEVDLADLLTILVEQMQPEAESAGTVLATDLSPPLLLWGDRDRLLQLFINLLENAFTYAPGSRVLLRGRIDADAILITVTDSGFGIPPEHLPHLFERFYRVDKARSRASGGSGLGLAIAQEIAHAHHATIQVASEVSVGTTFTVRFPQIRPIQQHQ